MFQKLRELSADAITVEIDGVQVSAQHGESVAAVILRQDSAWSRISAISGNRRAPYCMMGVCFDCLAEVDGVASVQTCLTTVSPGMRIRRQTGKRRIG